MTEHNTTNSGCFQQATTLLVVFGVFTFTLSFLILVTNTDFNIDTVIYFLRAFTHNSVKLQALVILVAMALIIWIIVSSSNTLTLLIRTLESFTYSVFPIERDDDTDYSDEEELHWLNKPLVTLTVLLGFVLIGMYIIGKHFC